MNRIKSWSVVATAAATLAFTGCDPDKCTITLPVSAIEKAIGGGVGYAKIRVYYSTTQKDVKEKLPQIKAILEQHLGEKANIQMLAPAEGEGSLTVSWKIPVGGKGKESAMDAAVAGFSLGDTWLSFAAQKGLEKLNADLRTLDATIKGGFMSDIDVVIKNDTEQEFVFLTCGTFVDEQPYVYKDVKVPSDEEVTVTFKRKSEDSVYHFKDPAIGIYKKK